LIIGYAFCQSHNKQHGQGMVLISYDLALSNAVFLWHVRCSKLNAHTMLLANVGQFGAMFQGNVTAKVFHLFAKPFDLSRCCFTKLDLSPIFDAQSMSSWNIGPLSLHQTWSHQSWPKCIQKQNCSPSFVALVLVAFIFAHMNLMHASKVPVNLMYLHWSHFLVPCSSIKLKITEWVRSSLVKSENCSTSQKTTHSVRSHVKRTWLKFYWNPVFTETTRAWLILSPHKNTKINKKKYLQVGD